MSTASATLAPRRAPLHDPNPASSISGTTTLDPTVPSIDDDGLLWFDDRWVALTDLQIEPARHLVEHLGTMVSVGELAASYTEAGGSDDEAAMRSLMFRLGRRFAKVGLRVVFARRRSGMLVEVPTTAGRAEDAA